MLMPESAGRGPLDRRHFLALGVGGLVVAALPRALAGARRHLVTRTVPVMGTIAEIRVVHDDSRLAERAIDAAVEELYRVDRTMTRFSRHSEVGRANVEAASHPVALGAATAAVVERALFWAERTGGSFDPCLGEACALWDVEHRHVPPPAAEARRFAGGLYRQLELGRRHDQTMVYFHSPRVGIDLGGIAKGWAVDRAVDALRAHGIRNAIVEAGGDLYAMGHSERGDAWEIGVQSPTNPHEILARFPLTDRAVATSGDYRRFFDYHGRRYSHLLDPRTGEPRQTREHSVSVEAETCMDADAGATAVFGASREQAQALLAGAMPGARLIHSA